MYYRKMIKSFQTQGEAASEGLPKLNSEKKPDMRLLLAIKFGPTRRTLLKMVLTRNLKPGPHETQR